MAKSLNDRINELQEKLEQVTAERDALASILNVKRWFVFDPETGFKAFEAHSEAMKYAIECIDAYLDDTWAEEIDGLCVGAITHQATQTNITKSQRDDFDYACNYEILPISKNSLAKHDAEVSRKAILAVTQQPDSIISRLPDSIWISARGVRSFADTYAEQVKRGEVSSLFWFMLEPL